MPKLITPVNLDKYVTAAEIICGDCRDVMNDMFHSGKRFSLIFADPPFNIGQKYAGYHDSISLDEYGQLIQGIVDGAASLLTYGGVLCLHGPDDLVEYYLNFSRANGLERIAWINWHYRFGQCSRKKWVDSRTHCLIYTHKETADRPFGNGCYTMNPEAVMVDSDRKTRYKDKRVGQENTKGEVNLGMRMPFTIWGLPSDGEGWGRVQGNNKERRHKHPNQLPERYLERLILYYTNPGDAVLDPCGGSGTTIAVATRLSRVGATIDVSRDNCESIRERLQGRS